MASAAGSRWRGFMHAAGDVVLSVLLIAAFHILALLLLYVFFGDNPLDAHHHDAWRAEQDEELMVAVPDPDGDGGGTGRPGDGFYDWLEAANPQQWLLPDYRSGFSSLYGNSSRRFLLPETPQFALKRSPLPPPLVQRQLSWRLKPRLESLQLSWQSCRIHPEATKSPARPVASRVYWRLAEGGEVLQPAPALDEQTLEYWRQAKAEKSLTGTTLIELRPQAGMEIPRIIIRESCGNPHLDQSCIGALRKYLLRIPAPPAPVRLEVDWCY